ncbi:ABC transporter ATP-binding protein [Rheinheimera sp. NSM]|uniref:ABC transporter ATP-binding protein n=1 Tax=Rheinheimera sp. NSM TaxID=3457884 RepID=UPI004036FCDD
MLQLNQLCYRYPAAEHNALDQLNLQLHAGDIVGVLGPNGAGKTTLFSLLSGLISPDSGSLHWHSDSPTVSLVPQHLAFYSQLSISENLHFFADIYRLRGSVRQQQLNAVIAACDLGSRLQQSAGTLSGGWQRRLNFAIGILRPAQLYLFDEATVGVDPASRQQLLDAVKALAAEGKTLLYTSHYLTEIEQIANRVLLLDQGRLQLDIDAAQLTAERQQLLVEWPDVIPDGWHALLLQPGLEVNPLPRGSCVSGFSTAQLLQLCQFVLAAAPAPALLRLGRPSLEQLYLHLTGGRL